MLTRPIPSTGAQLPVIGCGTWRGFDVGANATQRKALAGVITALFEAGGSVIDSSPMYGRAEDVTGDLLAQAGTRDKAFLATKVWISGKAAGIAQMQQSMKLLRTDHIDLMQVHNLLDWQDHLATLRGWKKEGRIGYLGVTHYTSSAYADLEAVMRAETLDFVQVNYALDDREAEKRILPLAADRGMAVLINRPFGGRRACQEVGRQKASRVGRRDRLPDLVTDPAEVCSQSLHPPPAPFRARAILSTCARMRKRAAACCPTLRCAPGSWRRLHRAPGRKKKIGGVVGSVRCGGVREQIMKTIRCRRPEIRMIQYLASLNAEQRRAVEHGVTGSGPNIAAPLLVIAGAGSGKTNTLAHRVAHLIMHGADPGRLLLLTFSGALLPKWNAAHNALSPPAARWRGGALPSAGRVRFTR